MAQIDRRKMKILTIFMALVVFVASCPPLLNNFDLLGNDTHSTADLVRELASKNPQLGWSEIVTKICDFKTIVLARKSAVWLIFALRLANLCRRGLVARRLSASTTPRLASI